MKKIIIIASEPRTGSNLLIEALTLYKPIRILNEFYINIDDNSVPDDFPHKRLIKDQEREILFNHFNIIDKNDYVNLTLQIKHNPIESLLKIHEIINDTIVVKIHSFIFNDLKLIEKGILDIPNVEIIVLERSSRLHSYVSNLKAKQTNIWHNVDTSDIKVHVDIADFIAAKEKSIEWYKHFRSELSNRNKDHLEVNYEKDLENFDTEKFYELTNSWALRLNLSKSHNILYRFKKQNNSTIENSIENFDEVKNIIGEYN